MPFDYYARLTPRRQSIYRASDRIESIPLGDVRAWRPLVDSAREHLEADRRAPLTRACQALIDRIVSRLGTPPVQVRVLAARPSRSWGELHGMYEPEDGRRTARITVWMRTAQRRQVVAYRTFLRTLLHELCHHLDYEHFALAETLHTEGFFKRESDLVRQLTSAERPTST